MGAVRSKEAYATRRPSADTLKCPARADGVVSGSGGASTRPDCSSIATRHKFMLPPRLLAKYRWRPSGDHTGFQSSAASDVTGTGVPPSAGIVSISRCPKAPSLKTVQYAIRWPCGDQLGWIPLTSDNRRRSPDASVTAQRSLGPTWKTFGGEVANTSWVPSGDQAGVYPLSVMRRTDSPVRPITKIPPPWRSDRNAIRSPSGENAGCVSSSGESLVRLIGFCPPTLCR